MANIFTRMFKGKPAEERSSCNCGSNYSPFVQYSPLNQKGTPLSLSAVFRAVELISDSIAVLPTRVKVQDKSGHKTEFPEHPLNLIFTDHSGSIISFYNLMKLLIQCVLLKGNGFAYIERKGGEISGLRFLHPGDVVINYNKEKNTLSYTCSYISSKPIPPKDIIHLVKNSWDGINGVSILTYASRSLDIANYTETQSKEFFQKGCNISGIINVLGNPTQFQMDDILQRFTLANLSGNTSGIRVLPGNMSFQPISLSAADSQMLQSREYNVSDIARFFGINPVLLGDLSKASYGTIEAIQIDFLTHTLQPYISMVEREFTRKLVKDINLCIDLEDNYVLRTDKTALSQYYSTLTNNGIMTINEARRDLGYSEKPGADDLIIPYSDTSQNKVNKTEENGE